MEWPQIGSVGMEWDGIGWGRDPRSGQCERDSLSAGLTIAKLFFKLRLSRTRTGLSRWPFPRVYPPLPPIFLCT